MNRLLNNYPLVVIALWGVLLFLPFLGAVHLFDWDEINFAESAREMLVTGNFAQVQINYKPFIEKPPLFFWLQALSMKAFGINEFASRLPNALIGIITLLIVFNFAKTHFGKKTAYLWVLFITGSFTPHLYYKSGIIDPLYNLFIFLSTVQLFLYIIHNNKIKHALLTGLFLGLAIITKGPVAIIILLLVFIVFWVQQKFKPFFKWPHLFMCMAITILTSATWFGLETVKNGPLFIIEFINYQIDLFINPVAGHGQPFWYHPLVLLFGAFPASVLAIPMLVKRPLLLSENRQKFILFNQILFWVTLVLFSLVKTKIVHYSSLCYLPITFLAAYNINYLFSNNKNIKTWQILLLMFIGLLVGVLFCAITLVDVFKENFIYLIDDEFAKGNLTINGNWSNFEIFIGMFFIAVVLVTIVKLFRQKMINAVILLLLHISIIIPVFLRIIVPHIEAYSQRSAIDFYRSLELKDCYVESIGFKSYAQYFYKKVLPQTNPMYANTEWLLTGSLDKPAYFVLKEGNLNNHLNPTMIELYRKGGFVFYKREPGLPYASVQTEQK